MQYAVISVAVGEDGEPSRTRSSFHTQDLALDAQTYPSVAPLADETVGVGMPVIVTFDVPVQDQALFEKHMTVSSTPKQAGSWRWLSDQEVHWRPDKYWRAGTDVTVDIDVNSLPAGGGVFGQESRTIDFHIGQSVVSKVNAQTHRMRTFINGKLAKTTPITTGKPGFTTRSGTKVIMEKFRSKRMNSETVGIANDAPDGYDINDVEYAMRVTYSGEFLHAAPWSVSSQGNANVSHGCTGMSTENAKWIYDISKRGDVVEYTGTDRPMTLTNGFGDWNLSPARIRQGLSARLVGRVTRRIRSDTPRFCLLKRRLTMALAWAGGDLVVARPGSDCHDGGDGVGVLGEPQGVRRGRSRSCRRTTRQGPGKGSARSTACAAKVGPSDPPARHRRGRPPQSRPQSRPQSGPSGRTS